MNNFPINEFGINFVGYEEFSRSRMVLSASVDNTLLDQLNSLYPTKIKPNSLIANLDVFLSSKTVFF